MGLKCEYNGKTYYRNNSKWVDEDSFVVPVYLQDALNSIFYAENDVSSMGYEEAKEEGDKVKRSESYAIAIKYYEQALNATQSYAQIAAILPRLTSCYRKINRPEKVIELLSDMKLAYGEGIINEALLTSAAAAYCDLGEPENALRCCRWGYRVLKNKTDESSYELRNVFIRANKMIDPDYSPTEYFEEY